MKEDAKPHDWLIPDWPAPSNVRAITTTRLGGVSQGVFSSMNLALHVDDDVSAVQANRIKLKQILGISEPCWLKQVHGVGVVDALTACPGVMADAGSGVKADGSYSTHPGKVCAVLTADCLPVLLCDEEGTRVAAVHAGWRGLLAGVIESVIDKLEISGDSILAWLGPAIGSTSFEVGEEVRGQFIQHHSQAAGAFKQASDNGKWLADIYQLARLRLASKSVTKVYGGGWCTFTNQERFYSYRRDGVTGRMASLIWMES
jgi:hypothetical protein